MKRNEEPESDQEWRSRLEDLELKVLNSIGLTESSADLTKRVERKYITIEMDAKPFLVRTYRVGDPRKDTLVLVHGLMCSSLHFYKLIPVLAKQYNLVMFDNCGWGLNSRITECSGIESPEAAEGWL